MLVIQLSPGSRNYWFPRKHDVILFYSKGRFNKFNKKDVLVPHKRIDKKMKKFGVAGELANETPKDVLESGKTPFDWWKDIGEAYKKRSEHLGYPTQKPMALLERIIKVSTDEGDLVLDPYCGSGTTIDAAQKLNREWVGIDVSSFTIDVAKNVRMSKYGIKTPVHGVPLDLRTATMLHQADPFEYEKWAIMRVPGLMPNNKQVGDGGIDGRGRILNLAEGFDTDLVLAQVKGGKFNLSGLRDFLYTIDREDALLGIYITNKRVTSKAAQQEIARFGSVRVGMRDYPRIQLWSMEDYFDGKRCFIPTMRDPFTAKEIIVQGAL